MPQIHAISKKLLNKFGIDESYFIGKGRESSTYAINEEQVLKIFTSGNLDSLTQLSKFYLELSKHGLPYQTPKILKVNSYQGSIYTIERRLKGKELDQVFPYLNEKQRLNALENHFNAIWFYNQISYPNDQFGQIISTKTSVRADSWTEYLQKKIRQKISAQPKISQDVINLDMKVQAIETFIRDNFVNYNEKSLVHADYYFTNVLVDDDLNISAVLDFGEHALVGDSRMDVAAAVDFLNINPLVTKEMKSHILGLARLKYGKDIDRFIAFYALFYNFYFADTKDKGLYEWSINGLNDDSYWNEIS